MIIRLNNCAAPNGYGWYKVHVGKTFNVTNAEKVPFENIPKGMRKDQFYTVVSANEHFNGKLILRTDCASVGAITESKKSVKKFL